MENASKALLMAAGILIGLLILALMVTLFASSKSLFDGYDATKESEAIQQFNVNFTKYVGQNLTIHDAITIYNFAIENGIPSSNIIKSGSFNINMSQISKDIDDEKKYYNNYTEQIKYYYNMSIEEYNNGYVSKIRFYNRHYVKI